MPSATRIDAKVWRSLWGVSPSGRGTSPARVESFVRGLDGLGEHALADVVALLFGARHRGEHERIGAAVAPPAPCARQLISQDRQQIDLWRIPASVFDARTVMRLPMQDLRRRQRRSSKLADPQPGEHERRQERPPVAPTLLIVTAVRSLHVGRGSSAASSSAAICSARVEPDRSRFARLQSPPPSLRRVALDQPVLHGDLEDLREPGDRLVDRRGRELPCLTFAQPCSDQPRRS